LRLQVGARKGGGEEKERAEPRQVDPRIDIGALHLLTERYRTWDEQRCRVNFELKITGLQRETHLGPWGSRVEKHVSHLRQVESAVILDEEPRPEKKSVQRGSISWAVRTRDASSHSWLIANVLI
jgi:hypothetical protein